MISIGYSAVSQRKVTRLIFLPFARSRLARLAGEGSEREAPRLISRGIAFVLREKKVRGEEESGRIDGGLMARTRVHRRLQFDRALALGTRGLITGKWHAPRRYSVSWRSGRTAAGKAQGGRGRGGVDGWGTEIPRICEPRLKGEKEN